MPRHAILLALTLALPLPALAQLPVAPGIDLTAWYRDTTALRTLKRPTKDALLNKKAQPIDASLARDLAELDWLDVGAWSYPEKAFGVLYADDQPANLDLVRHDPKLGDLSFQYTGHPDEPSRGQLTHTNFEVPTARSTRLVKIRGAPYLEVTAFGEKEVHRVVRYSDGVLVYDISYDGKPESKTVKFRQVRLALPRAFAWTPPEKKK